MTRISRLVESGWKNQWLRLPRSTVVYVLDSVPTTDVPMDAVRVGLVSAGGKEQHGRKLTAQAEPGKAGVDVAPGLDQRGIHLGIEVQEPSLVSWAVVKIHASTSL